MTYKISIDQTIYQGRGSNQGRGFGRCRGNTYIRGRGRGFIPTKPKVRGNREALGRTVYSIGDLQQADKYTKFMEAIIN